MLILTNGAGQLQPLQPGAETSYAAQPGWSRPLNNGDDLNMTLAPPQKPGPLKIWRKQLVPQNRSGSGSSSSIIPYDQPGSTVLLQTDAEVACKCQDSSGISTLVVPYPGDKNTTCCGSSTIRSGMTEVLINPTPESAATTSYSFTTGAYLRSKGMTYKQRASGAPVKGVTYTTREGCCVKPVPYNNSQTSGPQVRMASTCPGTASCDGSAQRIVVKPNNRQFFQQGAVSSSSRITRLKLNTLKAASALGGATTGGYNGNFTAPYYDKSNLNICQPSLYHRNGNKTLVCTQSS